MVVLSATVDIQGGSEFGWAQTDTTNVFSPDPVNQMFTIGSRHSIVGQVGACFDIPNSNDVAASSSTTIGTCRAGRAVPFHFPEPCGSGGTVGLRRNTPPLRNGALSAR